MTLAGRFADMAGTTLLMSGGDLDCAEHHILGVAPWFVLTSRQDTVCLSSCLSSCLSADGRDRSIQADPLAALKRILAHCRVTAPDIPSPISAGLTGYIAYDLKDRLENLPRTCVDDLCLPDMYLTAPQILVVHDKKHDQTRLHVAELPGENRQALLDWFYGVCEPPAGKSAAVHTGGSFRSNATRPEYEQAVADIIDYIAAGDVYQVNMSQRFETEFSGSPFGLFASLYQRNPAPFFAFINAGGHHIVSTSPERFIRQAGRYVETRPIKGTRPRGKTPAEDEANRRALLESPKDDAELSMIVDLLRNDLGRVCTGGSVKVTRHKKLEAYENVFHMISIVEGELADGRDAADILAAAFPGGSITGCPKIRSMEIIDELEPVRRHIYTGSIGYISFHDTMDLSIAIRTATICGDRLFYAAGGGIVYDSDPAEEFEETLAKADTMLSAFAGEDRIRVHHPSYTWLNGKIRPGGDAAAPLDSPGFQYGAGLFETIRAEGGTPQFLEDHVQRLTDSWKALFPTPPPDIDWHTVIRQVIAANRLETGIAAVKIMAAHGDRFEPPYNHTLAVTARPYIHRLEQPGKPGLDLAVYPAPRQVETASHKTLNYFFYYKAGQWAKRHNCDEALIMNPDDTVSETSTANILLIRGNTAIAPLSPTVLSGIMQARVLACLKTWGYQIIHEKVTLPQCLAADDLLLTNSLMGTVPVLSINGRKTASPSDLSRRLNAELC